MAFSWVFLSFVISSCVLTTVKSATVEVECPFGKIQGSKKTDESTGQSYLSFTGIPYARPPVGDLRFAKPQPRPNIDGVFDASRGTNVLCPHPSSMTYNETNFHEDCLVLNIQTKDIETSNALRKVVVFIHGGGFIVGSASFYNSTSFVISQGVIVVTINYRLGVLGFLSTENEVSPGNYGLWDQTLAIKWVKDNIRAFGGDPDDITIAGESAGGASVGYQAISPHTKGLFTKAYPQSGTATSVFARSIDAQSHALSVGKLVGCWDKDVENEIDLQESKLLVDCLRKTPISKITEFNGFMMSKAQFVPTVDGDFIPDIPSKLLQDDDYLESVGFFDRSYLIAINNNEFGIMENFALMTKQALFSDNQTSEEQNEMNFKEFLVTTKKLYMHSRLCSTEAKEEDVVSKIDDFYYRRFPDDQVIMNIVTDLSFLIPSLDYLAAASRRPSCSSYLLYFDHYPHFMKGKYKGSLHGLELAYWFDLDITILERVLSAGMQGEFTKEDLELKSSFSSLVSDFMKAGNLGWPKYDVTNSHYLNFNPKPWVSSFLEKDKQDLWFRTVPNLMKTPHVHSEL